ncbi:PaaI family thioesterase [Halomarina rubra]|uniref:PaaI family thioesterase n=1 Tax=Halomarina rubra TaxID=2071873 RepID=A0ABD6AS83_9EURY|nr:PaaI family thioesterase [Halomarina rubra]
MGEDAGPRATGDLSTAEADAVEEELRGEAESHGLFGLLGVELVTAREGHAVLTLPFDDRFTNLANVSMHGGLTATLVDTASGFALRSVLGPDARLTTTDMNVRYLRPATNDLRVEADVVRAGRSMGVTEARVTNEHDGEEKTVATGGTSYRLFRGEEA